MAEIRRLNLSLNLDSPLHREAWAALSAIPPGFRTTEVCRAVIAQKEQENLANLLREVMREELKHIEITGKPDACAAGDDDNAVLGFLRALQEGDDNFKY